jgi:Coenzyme PQQ synthesis protein D (PqqD)
MRLRVSRTNSAGPSGRSLRGPNLLDMTPRRDVEWEEDDGGKVTLIRERPRVRGIRSLGRWISFMMAPPRIRLDEVGSFVWKEMDGGTDVRQLVELAREEFGERAEPVAHRLGQFIRLLKRERFVSYAEARKDRTSRGA